MMQQQQIYQKIGKFKADLNKNSFHKVVKRIKPYFHNDCWDLGDRKFKDLYAKEFFQNAFQIPGITLWIDYNKNPSILKQISTPIFIQLQTIYLGDNNITLLQDLSFLKIPQISRISLNDNLISNIKSFGKCNFSKIQYISLNGNRIFQYQPFQKITFQKLQKLKLLDQLSNSKVWENINVLWLMKTSTNKQSAQIFFDPKFVTTPQLSLIKIKIRRKICFHPCSLSNQNNSSCSPIPPSE